MMRQPSHLRILIGTIDIAGILSVFADGFRKAGCEVTVAPHIAHSWYDHPYDVGIAEELAGSDWRRIVKILEEGKSLPHRLERCRDREQRIAWLIRSHDVFVFVQASLHHDHRNLDARMGLGREYPLLKRLGKSIISWFTGPDVRHWTAFDQQTRSLGFVTPGLGESNSSYRGVPLARVLRNLRRSELWSDAVYSQPNQSGLALRPYFHLFVPVNLSTIQYQIPRRQVPVVVHAPSDRRTKGSAEILAALEQLRQEGVSFHLRLLEEMPNAIVREELSNADVVIDQLHFPLHGVLGVEAMAAGCALATCDRPAFEPYPAGRPIWHIETTGLRDRLRTLLTDRALRIRLAGQARQYVRKYHDHANIARDMLAQLRKGNPCAYIHYPAFFASEYRLPEGMIIPTYLKRLNERVALRFGLPKTVTPADLAARGLFTGNVSPYT